MEKAIKFIKEKREQLSNDIALLIECEAKEEYINGQRAILDELDVLIKQIENELTPKKSKEEEMKEFFHLIFDKCEIIKLKNFPNSDFFVIGDKYYIEQDKEKKHFWVRHDGFASVFIDRFALNYKEIKAFLKTKLEEALKCEGYTTKGNTLVTVTLLEEALKCEGYTTFTPTAID